MRVLWLVVVIALGAGVACSGGAEAPGAGAGGITRATPPAGATSAPGTAPEGPPPDAFREWASGFCGALEEWSRAIAGVDDGGQRLAAMSLAERKARSARISQVEIAASARAAERLAALAPHADAAEYHHANRTQYAERARIVRGIEERVQRVSSIDELQQLNREYEESNEQRRRTVRAAAQFLPAGAIAALWEQGRCGPATQMLPPL